METRKMKTCKKLLYLAIIITMATWMAACSTSDDAEQQTLMKSILYEGSAKVQVDTTKTRGYWADPGSSDKAFSQYAWKSEDNLLVAATNKTDGVLVSPTMWSATVKPSADSYSADVSWSQSFNVTTGKTYSQLLISNPQAAQVTCDGSFFDLTFELPASVTDSTYTGGKANIIPFEQPAYNDMSGLEKFSYITAISDTVADGDGNLIFDNELKFHYLPVIFRFAIMNQTGRNIQVKNIEMVCNNARLKTFCNVIIGSQGTIALLSSGTVCHGMSVNVTAPELMKDQSVVSLYGLSLPFLVSDYANDTYTFYLHYTYEDVGVKVKDSFATVTGTQLSNALGTKGYYQFSSGNSYTFKIRVSQTMMSVTPSAVNSSNPFNAGWNDETEM